MGRPGPTSQPGPKGDKVMFLLFLYFSVYCQWERTLNDLLVT